MNMMTTRANPRAGAGVGRLLRESLATDAPYHDLRVWAAEAIEQLTAERDALQGDLNVRDHKIKGLEEAHDDLAKERDAWRTQYGEEYITVDRVWRALGITTYKDAGGKTISELVADMRQERDALLLALRELVAVEDLLALLVRAEKAEQERDALLLVARKLEVMIARHTWTARDRPTIDELRKALHSGDESVTPTESAETGELK